MKQGSAAAVIAMVRGCRLGCRALIKRNKELITLTADEEPLGSTAWTVVWVLKLKV